MFYKSRFETDKDKKAFVVLEMSAGHNFTGIILTLARALEDPDVKHARQSLIELALAMVGQGAGREIVESLIEAIIRIEAGERVKPVPYACAPADLAPLGSLTTRKPQRGRRGPRPSQC